MQAWYREYFVAPYDWYRVMRREHPVFYDEASNSWHVFCYADVARVLTEHATFSSEGTLKQAGLTEEEPLFTASILSMDPPRHRQLRSLIQRAFTPRMIARLAPCITVIVNELLDQAERTSGQIDVIRNLAAPLPTTVIAELLGIPAQRRADFQRWSDAVTTNEGDVERRKRETQDMYYYFAQVLEERRNYPQEDLISGLLAAEVDGQRLSERELLGFCALLLVAGNETTANLIGNAILCFAKQPEVVARLHSDPTLIPSALEEALRYFPPFKFANRITKTETIIGNQHIAAHQRLRVWLTSANRDEAQFPDPDRFDIQREPNHHLSFGQGIHFCLGAPLTRLEAKIAVAVMLERFPPQWCILEESVEPVDSPITYGLKRLPLVWRRGVFSMENGQQRNQQ
jgi:cytochrome P450